MWPFRGNINGSIYSIQQALPMVVDNFLLVNKTAGSVGTNVYLLSPSTGSQINMMPLNKQLAAGEIYESDRTFVMLATEVIHVKTSGETDFDFTINNIQPDQ